MMNTRKYKQFVDLLEDQLNGIKEASPKILEMRVELADGYCLFNLHQEYEKAFSYEPGCQKALEPIYSIAKRILLRKIDDTMQIYSSKEWKELIDMRGPVDCIRYEVCTKCKSIIPHMCNSGFLDIVDLYCPSCGDICFIYPQEIEKGKVPLCDCGGEYVRVENKCPKCKKGKLKEYKWGFPYEYFEKHRFVRMDKKEGS